MRWWACRQASFEESPCFRGDGGGLLPRGGGATDVREPGDLGDLEAAVAVQQEVAEQARAVVVVPAALAEVEGRPEQAALLGGESLGGELGPGQPVAEGVGRGRHGGASRTAYQGVL